VSVVLPSWFDPGDERAARVVWSRIAEPGDLVAARFVAGRGPAAALRLVLEAESSRVEVQQRWRARLAATDPRRDLGILRRLGGRVLVPGDEEWPDPLDDLGERRPFCLWVRGPGHLGALTARAVAIVGARASTDYGDGLATELAFGCAERGICVVSGAAYGVDAAAHRGALSAAGGTIAVLACGVDRPYPRVNLDLIEQVAAAGLLVSEVPPGCSPTRNRFIHRNRLIAALGGATVVVEAGWRSGASITASEAAGLGRAVGAVPGPVTSAASAGCHRLLRTGAVCVTRVGEVAELVDPLGAVEDERPILPRAVHDDLPEVDLRVLDALPLSRPAPESSLATVAGLDAAALASSLGRLELLGLARPGPGGWRRGPHPRQD